MTKIAWDVSKNFANQRKHGIAFEEAAAIFTSDVDYFEVLDTAHSVDEDRFIAIGPVSRQGIILVVWADSDDEVVRIVSARRATRKEVLLYHSYMKGTL